MIPDDVHAVIFDVYGTLLEGTRTTQSARCMATVAERFGLSPRGNLSRKWDEAVAAAHAHSAAPHPEIDAREIWRGILPQLADPEAFAAAVEREIHPVRPTPWARPLLELTVRRNLPLGIVSNAQAYTRDLLEQAFPDFWPCFEPQLCVFSYAHRIAKPDLRLFQHAAEPLLADGVQPKQILMVGDSQKHDGRPARQLGWSFLHVPLNLSAHSAGRTTPGSPNLRIR